MTADDIINAVLARERGYTDHAADGGGPTKYGITAGVLGAWRSLGRPATRAEVKALTEHEARDIYRQQYITGPRFDQIADDDLRALLVDFGVHSGPRAAILALQTVVGTRPDGILGPVTLAVLDRHGAREAVRGVLRTRGEFLASLLQRDRTQRVFAAGWIRRLMEFV